MSLLCLETTGCPGTPLGLGQGALISSGSAPPCGVCLWSGADRWVASRASFPPPRPACPQNQGTPPLRGLYCTPTGAPSLPGVPSEHTATDLQDGARGSVWSGARPPSSVGLGDGPASCTDPHFLGLGLHLFPAQPPLGAQDRSRPRSPCPSQQGRHLEGCLRAM